jgi:hypothetical protein
MEFVEQVVRRVEVATRGEIVVDNLADDICCGRRCARPAEELNILIAWQQELI